MAFQLSPGINITEIDLTGIVPAVATTDGAIAGVFRWGPLERRQIIDTEQLLITIYGKPSNFNPETWFTCSNFLTYGNRLWVSRAADVGGNTSRHDWTGNAVNMVGEYNPSQANAALRLANSITGNTARVTPGMVLSFANNTALPIGAHVVTVNASHVTMDAAPLANVISAQMVFRDDIAFTAAALQSDLSYTMADVTNWENEIVKNDDHYAALEANGHAFDLASLYVARYPGEMGNSLRVAVCDTADQYKSNTGLSPNAQINATASVISGTVGSNVLTFTFAPTDTANVTQVATVNAWADTIKHSLSVGDLIEVGNNKIGLQFLQVTDLTASLTQISNVYSFTVIVDDEVKLSSNTATPYLARYWEFHNSFDVAPGQSPYVFNFGNTAANDELHVVVVDEDGKFTGNPATILERYQNLSRATDAKTQDGATNYYKYVINQNSQYIWWANDRTEAVSNLAVYVTDASSADPLSMQMVGGSDGPDEGNCPFSTLAFGYDTFQSSEDIDISLVLQGKARGEPVSNYTQLGNYIIDNICENRKDCVGFISPDRADVVSNLNDEVNDVVEFRGDIRSTSYAVMDSGYMYQYDKYNDVYRWIPLNGSVAGLCARTDQTNDPWWSPAGLNRGIIKNGIRLAYNPRKAQRDILYKNGVNPVVATPGLGIYLFGDKTLLEKPSAFDRINVRRLFIVLEKAIAVSAKYTLFEFNDDFTRAQFRNLVNPFLRDVQGRRGITDFLVVCDQTNNTPEVVDRNEFIGDIYIKPARSINFIQLNFVAVRTGVAFSEVVGKF